MGNNLSANSLFHFTSNLTYLQNILKQGFKVRYSRESFESLLKPIKDEHQEVLLPMVCFCDIPLSNIIEHTAKYGNYGLGLSKDWGKKHGLSPVIYSHPTAETANILSNFRLELMNLFDIEENKYNNLYHPVAKELTTQQKEILENNELSFLIEQLENNTDLYYYLGDFIKYVKPYSGVGYTNGQKIDDIIFYNEKEWRHIPSRKNLFEKGLKDSYSVTINRFEAVRRKINIKIGKHFLLTFEPKDIKYIIVRNEYEIPELIQFLTTQFGEAPHNELLKLYSKIISIEQIDNDF